jgi:2-polyprenyl-3-methyl-5-hydroxy-6-metoxy-1,4-benzoquinol methylase
MIHYTNCPACNGTQIVEVLVAKDYTVSQQNFSIWHCSVCTLRFTQDVPSQNEIAPYYQSDAYISHSDTKKGFINNLYHWVRKKTLRSKRKLIEEQTKLTNGTLLDIGCGTGAFLYEMKLANWDITGLEPDDLARKKAAELYGITPFPSHELFDLPTQCYDAITMWHVLEHVHDLKGYLAQIQKLLRPKGKLFIAVPNYTSYDAQVYQQGWAAYDVPRHLYHFSPQSMQQLCLTFNLKLTTLKPMWFDSFYVVMLSEKYKKGSIVKAFFTGFISNLKTIADKRKCSSVIYVFEKS